MMKSSSGVQLVASFINQEEREKDHLLMHSLFVVAATTMLHARLAGSFHIRRAAAPSGRLVGPAARSASSSRDRRQSVAVFASTGRRRSRRPRSDGVLPRGEGAFEYHEEVELRITDLNHMGEGVGRVLLLTSIFYTKDVLVLWFRFPLPRISHTHTPVTDQHTSPWTNPSATCAK